MKKIFLLLLTCASAVAHSQTIEGYFERIRNNPAELTAFFSQMPKGGDLHHHYSGSVYAETYIDYVVQQDYVINEETLEVKDKWPKDKSGRNIKGWINFSGLQKAGRLPEFKQKLIQKWSVKDYNGVSYPSDKQFFETFPAFNIAYNGAGRLDTGLLEIKRRAQNENVSYIETMFTTIDCANMPAPDKSFNARLLRAQQMHDENATQSLLEEMYLALSKNNGIACVSDFNNNIISKLHTGLHIDDETFTMRYQNYVLRVLPPVNVFKDLVVAFASANSSHLVVGVNIVAPEDNEVSMRDYWLHMQMFKFCHNKFPEVKYAMHAGELTLGMVKPEDLSWHINEAVRTAGASRIGHGVDMAYESNAYDLLNYMAKHNIAIEINLYSNEFILKVKDDNHPISLYRDFNVPIVICTDDAGVLRSNLTHQYVLLATRYKNISYRQIKEYVFNSIDYSFIREESVKKRLRQQLKDRFSKFERMVLDTHRGY